ncbi:hypothetical protein HID58_044311 [Brassica napus]|uniref:Chitin-binding type-1 domain-containing protein n=2 Tax=Brassica napus TaxID=3708 RepID=A0ABQ8BKE8_BRANA|nr:hypothetical protein HID58_044311 [Brassica napus]
MHTEQCGRQAGGALCPNNLCCSEYGWCGSTEAYCALPGCQSQCTPSGPPPPPPPPPGPPPPDPTGGLTDIITTSQFDDMLKHRNDAACPARGFYTYDAFITAAKYFPSFCNNGDTAARKKELSAFFGQTSHETTGGWPTAPDGPYAWGYCFKEEVSPSSDYCSPSGTWPCAPGKRYYGRGPMQLSWNYNYGQCGAAIGEDLLNNPDLVSNDPVISFKTAIWFWMTPQSPKPSCHAVINCQWQPSPADIAAGRVPGYGVTTDIINGGLECGHGPDPRVIDRIGFYQRYCGIFGVNTGDNLDCFNQRPFASFKSFLDAAIFFFVVVLSLSSIFISSLIATFSKDDMAMLGGVRDVPANENSVEVESLARFAVDEHNKKENALLEFARVVKAKEQVVAGTMHHLTLEIIEAGKKKLYEAKVWVKPWLNFKELQEFKPASDDGAPSTTITPSDLGCKKDENASGWREVPGDDPEVQHVADHAVKTIQQRSNSLFPYELQEVVHANAEVSGEAAKYNMVLKLKRGEKEEKFKVEVHKNHEGVLHLNHMEQHHD